MRHARTILSVLLASLLSLTTTAGAQDTSTDEAISIYAAGLTNPRGFAWGDDGALYVALAGNGGLKAEAATPSAAPSATGTPNLVGEGADVLSDNSGAVVRIVDGCPEEFATGLPSYLFVPLDWADGVIDVTVLDGQMYALVDGGGEVAGHAYEPNGVYRIAENGATQLVADLSTWFRHNPVQEPTNEITPDGQPYAMIPGDGVLWISESNHEQLLTVAPDGTITRVVDLSPASLVDVGVPTGLVAAPEGGVYLGLLSEVPFVDGAAKVIHIAEDGTVSDVWTGLTSVTDIAIGPDGALYASELSTGNLDVDPFYHPNTGRVVRQTGPDGHEEIATGLNYPVHIGFGPDGGLFVSGPAIGANGGEGTVVRIDPAAAPVAVDEAALLRPDC